jgi:hypothetical protein
MDQGKKSGLSVQTLAISALAAVAAAVIVPMIWEKGTLIATAMTPVIVAVVSEALSKPAEKITAVAPKVVKRTATGAAVRDPQRFEPLPPRESTEVFEPLPPSERDREQALPGDDPFGLRAEARRPGHHWRIAVATGVAAFAIAVAGLTMSELVLGGPATKSSGRTTFIGGGDDRKTEETPTATPSAEPTETTPEPTATSTPTPTVESTAPTPTPTPTVSATPTATP